MTPKEKLQMIEDKIKLLNDNVLKYKKWEIAYANKGSNNLELMEFMFSKALEEKQKESVKNKKNKKEEK